MGSLSSIAIKKEKIQELWELAEGSEDGYAHLVVGLQNKPNEYGQNVSMWIQQTPEEIAEKKKNVIAFGRTFYSKGMTPVPRKNQE